MDFTNPLVYGVPAFLGLILLELTYSKTTGNKKLYHWKDLSSSLLLGIGSAVLGALIKTVAVILIFNLFYEWFNPIVNGTRMNIFGWESFGYVWYVWIFCMLLDDLTYYWFHRQNHMVRFFWAAHIVHHSSDNFNLGTAIRNGWFTILYKPLFYVWIVMIGFPPEMLVVCLGLEALWQFQLHSKYVPKLGIIEKFINTHTMHQVHHARNIEYMDKNHGGILNVFDRLFGTWKELDENIDIEYGVSTPPNSYNIWIILTHEYKNIWKDTKKSSKWKDKFMYVFGPPGWSHDGSSKTVKQMQQELKLNALNYSEGVKPKTDKRTNKNSAEIKRYRTRKQHTEI